MVEDALKKGKFLVLLHTTRSCLPFHLFRDRSKGWLL